MDYEGEQAMELEALEAIFPDQLEEWEGSRPEGWSAHGKTWAITIHPAAEVEDADADEEEPECEMQLVWAHTPTYPEEPPSIRLRSVRGLSDAELADATAELQRHIEESLGMPMIYNLVTAAQEWLAARVAAGPAGAGGADPDAEEKRRREEEEAARAAARAHGTPVTLEAFNEWKARFDAERKAAAAVAASSSKSGAPGDAAREARVTGRQWFMQQLAAGKGESSGSEAGEEELAAFEDEEDDEDIDAAAARPDEDEDEDDVDYEDEDEDDEDMLDDYLAAKGS